MKHIRKYFRRPADESRDNGSSICSCKRYILFGQSGSGPVLGKTLRFLFPVFISHGCVYGGQAVPDSVTETSIRLYKEDEASVSDDLGIDIFTFNDDRMTRLDSYQHFPGTGASRFRTFSTNGDKIFIAVANSRRNIYDWADIRTADGLSALRASLENEDREHPAMSGSVHAKAGSPVTIGLKRLVSEIHVRTLGCDFEGRGYRGSSLENVKVYLTNVNAETPFIRSEDNTPSRIINAGRFQMSDMERFKDPGIIFQEAGTLRDGKNIFPDIRLLCYASDHEKESPGCPFTRLVIEGEMNGKTWYWPIDINRDEGGNGIKAGCRYTYDIMLCRLGTSDPDTPVEKADINIMTEIQPWTEKEEYGVRF